MASAKNLVAQGIYTIILGNNNDKLNKAKAKLGNDDLVEALLYLTNC